MPLACATTNAARSADIPQPAQSYAAPAASTSLSSYNWNGFYAGINAGYGWGTFRSGAANLFNKPSGAVAGLQAGYNFQYSNLLLGVEGDVYWSGMSGKRVFPGPITTRGGLNWAASLRARAGFAADRALVYVTAGYGFGNDTVRAASAVPAALTSSSDTSGGWVLGAGIEYAFTDHISFKTEFLYTIYSSKVVLAAPFTTTSRLTTSILRAGVNYHF